MMIKKAKTIVISLVVVLLCACNPNAPKYENILDEVLASVAPGGDEEIHLVKDDMIKLVETFRYHTGFEKAPEVKNLMEYLFALDENLMFSTSDGVEAYRIDKEHYQAAVDSLCAYLVLDRQYPTATVLSAIHYLQGQYANAMKIDPQVGIGAAIWLNRFTQQAVKYCPDIRLLTDNCVTLGANTVGIIEMPEGESEFLTNIVVTDFDGEKQISFGVNMLVNKIATSCSNEPRFLLYSDDALEMFEAIVLTPGAKGNPKILARTDWPKNHQVVSEWLMPALGHGNCRLIHQTNCSLDLTVDRGEEMEVRTLRFEEKNDSCRFVFDPKRDIYVKKKPS